MQAARIVVTGAAGLVGQNLIPRLKTKSPLQILAIDKHAHNAAILRELHPDIRVLVEDISKPGTWQDELNGCTHLVIAHAQIGGLHLEEFVRNNVQATDLLLHAAQQHGIPYLVNISSSVVNSMAADNYTETKKAQEAMISASGIKQVVLRPTLMFGWFDRKHLGWLARFMHRTPVFPVPGDGSLLRQPLYAGDFCDLIVSSIEQEVTGAYNITGQERIQYIELMRLVEEAAGARTHIQRVPYGLFWLMLKMNEMVDKNPPFTTKQLEALMTPDIFEVIDWPGIFNVRATPLKEALQATFRDPVYSQIVLET